MKLTLALFLVLLLVAPAALAQYPRTVISEDATATWCVYCPNAYAGLEVMKQRYDATEFNSLRYYSSSSGGGLSIPESNARITYYGVTGFPTVVFDGTTSVVGADASYQDGHVYDPIVQTEIGRPSPLKLKLNSVDLVQPSGSIDLDITCMDAIANIANTKIRVVILENNVTYGSHTYVDVVRDMLTDIPLTVSSVGQVQNVTTTFPIDPTWKTTDLWLAVFVQNDTDKTILQSVSNRPGPAYSLRYWAKGPRVAVVPSNSGEYSFPDFAVYNLGTAPDVIRATLDTGTMPAGWTVVFTDGTNDYTGYADLALNPGEGRVMHVKVTPGASGYIAPRIVLSSPNLPSTTRTIRYSAITNDVQVLIVDDDGGQNFETMHADAIQNSGRTYGIWPVDLADVTAADLSHFGIVDWQIGLGYPTLTASDQAALTSYLNAGGRLFITGQDLGWEMNDNGGSSLTWYHNTLHANYVADNAAKNTLTGVVGDPIGNGITIALTPSMNPYPDAISPYDSYATVVFNYDNSTYKGALKVDTGVYKVVYLGFGYEAITSQDTRRLLMQRSLNWLAPNPVNAPEGPVASGATVHAFPNPASGGASLSFALPSAGPVKLSIYSPDGKLVRSLVAGVQPAGVHVLRWDGRDNAGKDLSSGIYFYRLEAGKDRPSGKIVLTR